MTSKDAHARVSRRAFLRYAALSGGALLAACGGPPIADTNPPAASGATAAAPAESAATAPAAVAASTPAENIPTPVPLDALTAASKPGGWTPKLPPFQKYDPPVTVAQNFDVNSATQFINGETIENNVWLKHVKEQLGIEYQVKWAAQGTDANTQKWGTAMASGDLPEFMVDVNAEIFTRLTNANQLEDITDIWERVASPLLKQKKGYPDGPLWRYFPDKRVHAIPTTLELAGNDSLMWIRQDWLDQVDMKAPTTLDELGATAKAFKDKGLATIGISICNEFVTYMSSSDHFFGAFGVMPGRWLKGSDSQLVYGSTLPGIKDALAQINKWYAAGLIDPEFITTDPSKSTENIAANKVGIYYAPYWSYGWPIPDSIKNDPNAKWTYVVPPVAGPKGTQGRAGQTLGGTFHAFNKGTDPQKIEAVIQHINWALDRWVHGFENQDYHSFGYTTLIEGYDYLWDGDMIKQGPTDIGTVMYEGTVGYPRWFYPEALKDYIESIAPIRAKDPKDMNAMERYLTKDEGAELQQDAYLQVASTTQYQIMNQFIGANAGHGAERRDAGEAGEGSVYCDHQRPEAARRVRGLCRGLESAGRRHNYPGSQREGWLNENFLKPEGSVLVKSVISK